jgi:hypothetical protein
MGDHFVEVPSLEKNGTPSPPVGRGNFKKGHTGCDTTRHGIVHFTGNEKIFS